MPYTLSDREVAVRIDCPGDGFDVIHPWGGQKVNVQFVTAIASNGHLAEVTLHGVGYLKSGKIGVQTSLVPVWPSQDVPMSEDEHALPWAMLPVNLQTTIKEATAG